MEISWDRLMEMEDFLQQGKVFLNGFTNKPAHSDSYMTIVDFNALDGVFAKNPFTTPEWEEAVKYWTTNENMQPPLRMVGFYYNNKFQKV